MSFICAKTLFFRVFHLLFCNKKAASDQKIGGSVSMIRCSASLL
jgi:hypothetical protein